VYDGSRFNFVGCAQIRSARRGKDPDKKKAKEGLEFPRGIELTWDPVSPFQEEHSGDRFNRFTPGLGKRANNKRGGEDRILAESGWKKGGQSS